MTPRPDTKSPRWPWLTGFGAMTLLGGAWALLRHSSPKPLAPAVAHLTAAEKSSSGTPVVHGQEAREDLHPALIPLTPKLQPMIDAVATLARPLGLKGWPTQVSNGDIPVVYAEEWSINADPLLNRVWGNAKVRWHATSDSKRWDAMVVMESLTDPGPGREVDAFIVLVKDVFGSPHLEKLTKTPYSWVGLFRGDFDGPRSPALPDFVRTGELWSFYQTDEASGPMLIWAYHPSVGLASELYLESKAEHKAGLDHDKSMTAESKAIGTEPDVMDLHASQHDDAEHPSNLFIDDLASGASEVRPIEGVVFFKLKGRGPFFTSANVWSGWVKQVSKLSTSPLPANVGK